MDQSAEKYFKLDLQGQSPRRIIHGIGEVDLRTIELPMAEKLWKMNFSYIHLTDAGIEKYIKGSLPLEKTGKIRYSSLEIIDMIKKTTCADDCREFASFYPDNLKVQKAFRDKMQKF